MVIKVEKQDIEDAAQSGEYPVLVLDRMTFDLDILILAWSRTTNSKDISKTILKDFAKQLAREVYNHVYCLYNKDNLLNLIGTLKYDKDLEFFAKEFHDNFIALIEYKDNNSLITRIDYNGISIR